ncbi:ATP synthase F1 subunit gamma [Candidatus Daviesbacteria bacterium RIFCSPLOWO2_02_FULL_36_7]|uniref:ATP synthase gamma chain n=1 Tax=Candidatus Daviesbacteria bacterium RIFCSPLOWO2_02_FULL_36_7 TaxID=1797792 RepID=A0A1F5MG28_9BACT|nr:MAG: ATP synthase F1 subunit gamma [Candidatus Daviesbacteria bacterium RIFCSPLOWO2_02_FULL_36_7]
MANTRELRRRIRSIKNTSQITKAMQMVAATKMRRAQNQAISGRPYTLNLGQALIRLLPKINVESHPLLSPKDVKTAGVILLSTDKGLVGALNTNLTRTILASNLPADTIFYTLGRKGRSFIARTGKNLKADFENPEKVTFRQAKQLSKLIVEAFISGEIGEAFLIYPEFISTLRQQTKMIKLLPISLEEVLATLGVEGKPEIQKGEFLFEPDPDTLLEFILIHHIETRIYQALLETKASEHSARMIAMQNATDNALEILDDLKLSFNQGRQAAITKEILEISTAQVAMG